MGCLTVLLLCAGWLPGQDPAADPALDIPRKAFVDAVEKARQDLLTQIHRKIEASRQKGDRQAVKKLKDDQEALEQHPAAKLGFPAPAHQAALEKAGKTLQADYARIIRQNTMDGRDDRAEWAEKDLKKLLASIRPPESDDRVPPDPELADPKKPWTALFHTNTMRHLVRSGGSASAPGTGLAADFDVEGHFQIQPIGPGLVRVLHRKTGKLLTPAVVQAKPGTAVVLKAPMKTEGHQAWQVVQADKGMVRLIHQRTGRPLTIAENSPVVGDLAKLGPESLWTMKPIKN
ncbi:MAG: RICIN domain-containing protein [Gemmataceae bacterium]